MLVSDIDVAGQKDGLLSEDTEPGAIEPGAIEPPAVEGGMPSTPRPPATGESWGAAPAPGGTAFVPPAGPSSTWNVPPPTAASPGAYPGSSWGMPPAASPGNPYWGVPVPPAGQSRTARVHVIWLVVVLVAALGCGATGFLLGKSSAQIGAAIKSRAAAAGATGCTGTSRASGVGAHLASELLPLPSGTKYLSSQYKHRVDSLNQYVSTLYSGQTSEKTRLVGRCFQAAAQQGWVTPSGLIVSIYLVQFATPADARSYALATQSADLADPRDKLHHALRGAPDGMLIEAPALDKYGNTLSRVIADQGNVTMIMHIFVPAHLPTQALTQTLLRRQAARL